MLDLGCAAAGDEDADQVDADAARWGAAVGVDPVFGEVAQPGGLLRGHRGHGMFVAAARAGLDLADDQDLAVPGHDVDLAAAPGAPVARQDRHPALGQPPGGQVLSVPADRFSCVHVGTTSGANRHASRPT